MEKKQAKARGGVRPGAGRPALFGAGMHTIELYIPDEQMEWLGKEAKARKTTRSAIVRGLIMERMVLIKSGRG